MSLLKKMFGQYFPDVLLLPDSATETKVKLKIGEKIYDASIEESFFIKLDALPSRFIDKEYKKEVSIAFDDFLSMFEGISDFVSEKYRLDSIKLNDKYPIQQINEWTDQLFSVYNSDILNNFKSFTGLNDQSIRNYHIGYDKDSKLIVAPILNFTGEAISAINFYNTDDFQIVKNEGDNRLFGYHEIINGKYKIGNLIIATNEFEAILLRQLGYDAVALFGGWEDHFNKYLRQFHILIYDDFLISHINWGFGSSNGLFCNSLSTIKQGKNSICNLVTQKKYTKSKIDELINNKISVSFDYYRNYENLSDLKLKIKTKNVEFTQCFVDGIQYYGIEGNEKLHFISGERKNVDIGEFKLNNNSVNLIIRDEIHSQFSHKGYEKFLINNYTPSKTEAFRLVKEYLSDYIYFTNNIVPEFIALWVIGTYLYLNFENYPYIHIQAPKNSGKSTLLDVLSRICFNANYDVGPTAPVIFRQIENFSSTILLDEAENFKSNAEQKDIFKILNQGYSRKGKVHRTKGDKVISYKVYSPKVFAGINELNEVLFSRSIKVQMDRKPSAVKLERFRVDKSLEYRIQKILDELYMFGLIYAKEVDDVDKKIQDLPEAEGLNNRELDIWGPIYAIAKVVDENGKLNLMDTLASYVELDRELKIENSGEEDDEKLTEFLKGYLVEFNMLKKNKERDMIFDREKLFEAAKSKNVLPKGKDSPNKFTTYLKDNFKIESKNVDVAGDKNKKYVVSDEALDKFLKQ